MNARFKKSLSFNTTGQELGITKEAVRQWESKALRKLRRSRVTREIQEKFEIIVLW
ncbi:sigma factor-like helix-turn-helix DNA-binding protein [Mobilisporobacter senegalensis]|uniref:sigma factor-like helix-turn-helix DNA-binding protein n=1 Tax=Mobilisporobacter senegalensis TaxID=1329262 RepID=UPI0038CBFC69